MCGCVWMCAHACVCVFVWACTRQNHRTVLSWALNSGLKADGRCLYPLSSRAQGCPTDLKFRIVDSSAQAFFEVRSHCLAYTDLELVISLPQSISPGCLSHRHATTPTSSLHIVDCWQGKKCRPLKHPVAPRSSVRDVSVTTIPAPPSSSIHNHPPSNK